MNSLLTPTPFGTCSSFAVIAQSKTITFEVCDNYQKQTYRNRFTIYGANGKLQLHIPVIYSQKNRTKYKDIKIFNDNKWQISHWKSLESAYKTSPFFEYYEDEIKHLFFKKYDNLLEFNLDSFKVICECIQLEVIVNKTLLFNKKTEHEKDFRHLAERNNIGYKLEPYTQVFSTKHGYLNNLSILDLLFNEGPNTIYYLQSQKLINV